MEYLLILCKHYNKMAYPLIIQAKIINPLSPFINIDFSPLTHQLGSY